MYAWDSALLWPCAPGMTPFAGKDMPSAAECETPTADV